MSILKKIIEKKKAILAAQNNELLINGIKEENHAMIRVILWDVREHEDFFIWVPKSSIISKSRKGSLLKLKESFFNDISNDVLRTIDSSTY